MKKTLPGQLRASLPPVSKLKEQVRGVPDLELIVQRVEQIELLLEGIAELKGARNDAERAAAEAKVAANRRSLGGPLPERQGTRPV